ncbi:MAG: hypothetical protein O2931_17575, partial [Planctomycetota bacterium]|nr:hypothetical protein [Planctomycetota bacterium]MDA1180592.1 hypothetical protein [Planctomycetota bacterium]
STNFRMIVASEPPEYNCRRVAAEVRGCDSFQGLTPLAIDLRRVAAKSKYLRYLAAELFLGAAEDKNESNYDLPDVCVVSR